MKVYGVRRSQTGASHPDLICFNSTIRIHPSTSIAFIFSIFLFYIISMVVGIFKKIKILLAVCMYVHGHIYTRGTSAKKFMNERLMGKCGRHQSHVLNPPKERIPNFFVIFLFFIVSTDKMYSTLGDICQWDMCFQVLNK